MPKKAFSGKQKKLQLQAKKERQKAHVPLHFKEEISHDGESSSFIVQASSASTSEVTKESFFVTKTPINRVGSRINQGKYSLIFRTESKEVVEKAKRDARKKIYSVLTEYLECETEDFYIPELNFPIRPEWNYNLTPSQIENNENRYFMDYLNNIDAKFDSSELSYFELNLETWRQLWRVIEMSDILLCIVDIRFPPLLFPPKLYDHVCGELKKKIILVLNKIDLSPPHLVLSWKDYFKEKYPEMDVLCFTSFPSYNLVYNAYESTSEDSLTRKKRKGKMKMASEGALEVYKACEKIVSGEVDLTSWRSKIQEEMNSEFEDNEVEIGSVDNSVPSVSFEEMKKYNDGILTIGCVGQPNVGKSSLINALMGKKVVSVSKTPGHTKHFQTIFLTKNVRLCDCPGLIFPSRVPKPLQVLCGSYPIAQLKEPYSTIKYLAERLDLPNILKISHPEGETDWCAFDITDGWAQKRGYITAKAARLDSYRGANHLLRLALEGRIRLCLRPPGFTQNEEKWKSDARVKEIEHIQAKILGTMSPLLDDIEESSEDDEDGGIPVEEKASGEVDEEEECSPSIHNKFALLLSQDE